MKTDYKYFGCKNEDQKKWISPHSETQSMDGTTILLPETVTAFFPVENNPEMMSP